MILSDVKTYKGCAGAVGLSSGVWAWGWTALPARREGPSCSLTTGTADRRTYTLSAKGWAPLSNSQSLMLCRMARTGCFQPIRRALKL